METDLLSCLETDAIGGTDAMSEEIAAAQERVGRDMGW